MWSVNHKTKKNWLHLCTLSTSLRRIKLKLHLTAIFRSKRRDSTGTLPEAIQGSEGDNFDYSGVQFDARSKLIT